MTESQPKSLAAQSHVTYDGEPFVFGHGVIFRSTDVSLFATNMLAFARAPMANLIQYHVVLSEANSAMFVMVNETSAKTDAHSIYFCC